MIDPANPIFQDDEKAREFLEAQRWPEGPVCPHCKTADAATKLKGKSTRPGLYKCRSCEKPYTVTVGTLFERSKVPLRIWLYATFLLSSSKKGMSAHQLHRMIGVQYKTAHFMFHRIREAMRSGPLAPPMGGAGEIVEVDETYIGRNQLYKNFKNLRGYQHKHVVLTLVQRNGEARSFHVERTNARSIVPVVQANIDRETAIATDEANTYFTLKEHFAQHGTVNHKAEEWVRGAIHTNTVEGFFSIFKKGMRGVYQHCSEKHLHRYLAEFDFRYSNRAALGIDDDERACKALKGIEGRRLMYRRPHEAERA